jgi:ketosteroid isomerase-like protein
MSREAGYSSQVPEENVELIRRALQAAGELSLQEAAETYWHPDVEYVEDPRWPGASRYMGRDAVVECFQAYLDALGPAQDMSVTVDRVLDAGERQVAFVRVSGRSASGAAHEHLWAYVVETRDGRIVFFRAYYEPDEALNAVGHGT